MATLSTHVLDTAAGRPAAGPARRPGVGGRRRGSARASPTTTAGSRRSAGDLAPGDYVLRFDTGAWFAARGRPRSTPRWSSPSPSPTTSTTTCRCCSTPSATRPTVAAEPTSSSAPAGRSSAARSARSRCGVATGVITAVDAVRRRPPAPPRSSSSPTTRCCCPASSTPTCTSTSPAAPSGRASRPRPAPRPPAASRRSSTCRSTASRRPRRSRRWTAKRAAPRARCWVDVGFWGGAVPGNVGDLAPLHEAGRVRLQVLPARLGRRRVPATSTPAEFAAAMAETARLGALLIVHAEDGDAIGEPRRTGRRTPASSRSPARRGRGARDRRWSSTTARATGGARTSSTSARRAPSRRCAPPARPGVAVSVETCPHYLHFDAERDPRRRHRVQVLPADPRRRQPRRAVGRRSATATSTWSSPTTRRARPTSSARTPATSARRGAASRRSSSACPPCGPARARAGYPSPTSCAGWRRRPAGRVGLARKGRIAVGADADLCVFAPDEEFVVDAARLHHKNPVSAYAGRTLTGVVRRTWLRGEHDRPGRSPARPAAEERRDDDATTCRRRAAGADRADDRPGRVHRGVRRPPARHHARHRHQPAARTGTTPGCG